MLCVKPFQVGINQALSQVGHVSNWHLLHVILHEAPYSILTWIKVRAIHRP